MSRADGKVAGGGPWDGERLTRRRFVQAGALMLTLAACRNTSNDPGADTGATGSTASGSGPSVSGTRTVETPLGMVEVPAAPQRIAALVGSADVDALAFGMDVVYSGDFATGWVDLPESTVTSSAVPPEVEVVAATSPDLLIGWGWLAEEPSWKQLEKIAPAVTLPEEYTGNDYWREVFTVLSDYVNRADEGAAMLADFDARTAALAAVAEANDPITVGYIRVWEPGSFDWVGHDREVPGIMEAAGIAFEGPKTTKSGYSLERLDEVTTPTLLLEVLDEKVAEEMLGGPIWPTLPAVQADQVIEIDGALWGGYGILWANALLDDIERLFFAS